MHINKIAEKRGEMRSSIEARAQSSRLGSAGIHPDVELCGDEKAMRIFHCAIASSSKEDDTQSLSFSSTQSQPTVTRQFGARFAPCAGHLNARQTYCLRAALFDVLRVRRRVAPN
jgi:hypothetical protein